MTTYTLDLFLYLQDKEIKITQKQLKNTNNPRFQELFPSSEC